MELIKLKNFLERFDADLSFLRLGGNSWSTGTAPAGMEKASSSNLGSGRDNGSNSGFSKVNGVAIALIVIAVLALVVLLLSLIKKNKSSSSHYLDGRSHYMDDQLSNNRSFTPLVANDKGVFFPLSINDIHCTCKLQRNLIFKLNSNPQFWN
jgi:hypothetical protein